MTKVMKAGEPWEDLSEHRVAGRGSVDILPLFSFRKPASGRPWWFLDDSDDD